MKHKKCFALSYFLTPMALLAFVTSSVAQISGTVKDGNGEPLVGVSVLQKGTTRGVVTDVNGIFNISVEPGTALKFSSIGYNDTEEPATTGMSVTMEEGSQSIDDVVVTALGMKRSQKALGYSVTEMKGDELKTNNINPVASLQGKVAGLDISGSDGGMFGSTKILIRGSSTLKGNNQPIYVIDGIILDNNIGGSDADWSTDNKDFGNELKNLNPDDFETVSVLKGAAATALYGSRGLNGAVVITTKSGKARQGLGVSISQTFGIDHVFATPKLQNEYGAGNYSGNIGSYNSTDKWDNANAFFKNSAGVPTLRGGQTRHFGPSYQKYSSTKIEDYDGSMISYAPVENNYRDAYNLGFNSNTNVTVSGGNDKTTFYTSLSYKHATGTLPKNAFDRLAMTAKASQRIGSRVKLDASIFFANSTPKNPQPNLGDYFADGRFGRSYDTKKYMKDYKGTHGGIGSNSYGDPNGYNPMKDIWFQIFEYENVQKETNIRPTLAIEADLTHWLKFRAEGNYNYYYIRGEEKKLGTGYANEGGEYSLSQETKEQTNVNANFIVNKDVGDFNFGGFVRGEYYNTLGQYSRQWTKGGLLVPGQYFLGNSKETIGSEGNINNTKTIMSVAFQVSASWKNQIFVDVTGRNDWSSALVYTNKTGNYSYFYPSVNGSWLINETFSLPQWISLLKVRGSWAQVGNDTNPYTINGGYGLNNWANNGNIYGLTIPDKIYDPSIRPERKNAWEVGIDWRFFDGRINIDVTYYKENTKDQIIEIKVPSVSGINNLLTNAGNIENSGVELALNTIPIRTKDWEWGVDFTYTKNDNKIISLHPSVAEYILLSGEPAYGNYRIGSVAKIGGDYGVLMSDANPKKNDNGQPILTWRDDFRAAFPTRSGKVEEIGKITPDFLGSLATSVRWKDLSLRVAFDARFGGYVASYNSRYGYAYGLTETSLKYRDLEHGGIKYTSIWDGKEYTDGVIPDGVFADGQVIKTPTGDINVGGMTFQEAHKQGLVDPVHGSTYNYWLNSWGTGTNNDTWYTKLSYIALREISLAYRIPSSITSKFKSRNLSFILAARNLGYLYNTMPNNENPESIRGTNNSEFRTRNFSPYTANYMFTINIDF